MRKKRSLLLWIWVLSTLGLSAQTHNPKLWYLGYQSPVRDTNSLDTGFFLKAGSTVLDFRTDPFSQFRVANTLSIGDCNAFIFNDKDSLILYSNGSKVFNGKHRLIEGADSLNYGANDWANSPFRNCYYGEFYIRLFNQAMIAIPSVSNKNQYYLISIFINGDLDTFDKIVYSVVDMSLNNGNGKMIKKEVLIKKGDFTESIVACRHANGRDWWFIAREYSNTCFTVMLLDSSGIRVISSNQCQGFNISDRDAVNRNGINRFSWDGKLYASFTHKGIEVYNFDRCTGALFNRKEIHIPDSEPYYLAGCFSPDSKILYVNNGNKLFQTDMVNFSIQKVADWDGYKDTTGSYPYWTGFGLSQLAPDGKIYFGTTAFTHYLHRIEQPNVKGLGCNVVQRVTKIQTLNSGIPHFPNYELGAMVCCQGVSLPTELARTDTTVVAMSSASAYQWVDCDSGYKAIQNATARIFKPRYSSHYACVFFDKDGCSDTSNCTWVDVVTSHIVEPYKGNISVYPNPARDYINIDVKNLTRNNIKLEIYDLLGRFVLRENLNNNHSQIDISSLKRGLYFLKVIGLDTEIFNGIKLTIQ